MILVFVMLHSQNDQTANLRFYIIKVMDSDLKKSICLADTNKATYDHLCFYLKKEPPVIHNHMEPGFS